MGNIQDLLAQILSARYGRDVRQSIHDAIETCYEDGHAGAIDLQAREDIAQANELLGDTDISGISETVTGAVVELGGAVETAQETADGNKTQIEALEEIMDEVGKLYTDTNSEAVSLTTSVWTRVNSLNLPAGVYEMHGGARIEPTYTGSIGLLISTEATGSSEAIEQATTDTSRQTLATLAKPLVLNTATTINFYVLIYGSGHSTINSSLSALKIK